MDEKMFHRWFLRLTILAMVVFALGTETGLMQFGMWSANYFDNLYLLEPSVVSQQEDAILFDWGTGSPALQIPADNFSARWGADTYFPAGNYRFYALADENVRVIVDQHTLIDTFEAPAVGELLTAEVTLTWGVHHVQVDYQEFENEAYIYITWINLDNAPDSLDSDFFPLPQDSESLQLRSWTAEYFSDAELSDEPELTRTEPILSHVWDVASPAPRIPEDFFSARWTSEQTLDSGIYELSVQADDGVRVWLDDTLVIDEWHEGNWTTYTHVFTLDETETLTFRVEYYEATALSSIDFRLNLLESP
jgi:hypothetical protein